LLAILAAMAEQESRTLSKNVKFGFKEKFRNGEVMLCCSRFLGYKRDENDRLEVIEEEAKIVRRIFREFINGYSTQQIAGGLTKDKVPTLAFKNPSERMKARGLKYTCWYPGTIRSILQNEKYRGDCLFQKSHKPELMGKRIKVDPDKNEVDQFYLKDSHPAIISEETFELAQAEYARRQNLRSCRETGKGKHTGKHAMSAIIECGNCGSRLRRYASYYKEVARLWVCIRHQLHKEECDVLPIKEDNIKAGYLAALKELVGQANELCEILRDSIDEVLIEKYKSELAACEQETACIQEEMLRLYKEKGRIGESDYYKKESEIVIKIENLTSKRIGLECKSQKLRLAKYRAEEMLELIGEMTEVDKFDDELFKVLTEKIVIIDRTKMRIFFKCGIEVEAMM
jgi:hypothetical protein